MTGTNKIVLNSASMNAAMQEWCDAHLKDKVRVADVSYISQECVFAVKVEAIKAKEAA